MKKLFKMALVCAMAFSVVMPSPKALTAWNLDSWVDGEGYGSATKVDENITNLKGEAEAGEDGMFEGPYSKASTAKLADGIHEEVYVSLDSDNYAEGEHFEITTGLKNKNGEYINEALVMTQKVGDKMLVTAGWAPDFKVEVLEDGVYTYQYKMFVKDEVAYVNFSLLKWDEVIGTTGDVEIDSIKVPGAFRPVLDEEDVSVKYVWFCGIKVAKGVNVYTELPEKPVVPEEPEVPVEPEEKPDNALNENPNTYDAITNYVALAVLACGALGFATKKVLSN